MLRGLKLGRSSIIFLAASLFGAALTSAAGAETLRLGNEGNNPPFAMIASDGTLTGFEPELATEVCKRMQVDCDRQIMDFRALVPSLIQGKYDLLISNLTPTPERLEKLIFTRPIVANPVTFVVPADSNYELTPEGVKGKGIRIGLLRGGANSDFAKARFGDTIEYSYYDNSDGSILDLKAGRINMLFMPKISAVLRIIDTPDGKNWKLAGGDFYVGQENLPLDQRGNAWALRKDQPDLKKRVDDALNAIIADCTYTKIRVKYISVPTLPGDAACAAKSQ